MWWRIYQHPLMHIFTLLSSSSMGCRDGIPLDGDSICFKKHQYHDGIELISWFSNDGFELAVQTREKTRDGEWRYWDNAFYVARPDFHRIVRWYLWRWAWGEWFGLRRRLWYRLLGWRLDRMLMR